jgi:hypothetical protein
MGVLTARAEWVWQRTTPTQRRAFFASGLSYDAGSAIDRDIRQLANALVDAELGFDRGDIKRAGRGLVEIAQSVSSIRPFDSGADLPDWRDFLVRWISGTSVADSRSEAVQYVQDGLVYRLVWAVEAIRTHAEILGLVDPGAIGGNCSLALTYGVPTRASAALLRRGLPSRSLAMAVAGRFPRDELSEEGLDAWVDLLIQTVEPESFGDDRDADLWRRFAQPEGPRTTRWERAASDVRVRWLTDPPPDGTEVRVLWDGSAAHVCAPDLTPIGVAADSVDHVTRAEVRGGGLRVETFGPAA